MNQKSKLTFGKIFERFSYGCGDFGCNIIYTAMSAFLLFYYTDYANVSAMAVGTIMMVSRIFDGVSDIIMGVIVDRTRSKYGKARPWILRMCIPFAVSGILLFSVPASWASTPKLVYVFITYNLVSTVIYTAINVPYSALNALMTQDPYERSVLSIFRNLLATARNTDHQYLHTSACRIFRKQCSSMDKNIRSIRFRSDRRIFMYLLWNKRACTGSRK